MSAPYLQPPASLGLSRRRWPRLEVKGRLRAQISLLELSMGIRDISRGGFAVESPVRFAHGEFHELSVLTPDNEQIPVRARAVYCHARRDRANSFFVGWEALGDPLTTQAMTRLVDLVTSWTAAAAPAPPVAVVARR